MFSVSNCWGPYVMYVEPINNYNIWMHMNHKFSPNCAFKPHLLFMVSPYHQKYVIENIWVLNWTKKHNNVCPSLLWLYHDLREVLLSTGLENPESLLPTILEWKIQVHPKQSKPGLYYQHFAPSLLAVEFDVDICIFYLVKQTVVEPLHIPNQFYYIFHQPNNMTSCIHWGYVQHNILNIEERV